MWGVGVWGFLVFWGTPWSQNTFNPDGLVPWIFQLILALETRANWFIIFFEISDGRFIGILYTNYHYMVPNHTKYRPKLKTGSVVGRKSKLMDGPFSKFF